MLRVKVIQGVLTRRPGRDDRRHRARLRPRRSSTARRASASRSTGSGSSRSPRSSRRLDACGLTTSGACGDITRNVVGCTLAGIGHERGRRRLRHGRGRARVLPRQQALLEPAAQVQDLDHRLPRGLRARADQRRRAVRRDRRRRHARASTCASAAACRSSPHFARWLDIFVTPEEAPEIIAGVTAIFRDSEENRQKRGRARLKFLVDRDGARGAIARSSSAASAASFARRPDGAGPPGRRPHRRHAAARRRALRGRPRRTGRAACAPSSCSRSCGSRASTAAARCA